MPIRIRPDDNQGNYNPRSGGRGGGGGGIGGGGLMQFLPLLLQLFGRNPKLLLLIAIIGGGYMLFSKGCGGSPSSSSSEMSLSTGANFDAAKYAATEIFEPLADNKSNPLPEGVSLLKYAPTRGNQGQQGSCVAWAAAYAARTIMQARATGQDPNTIIFSPSFLYNQIALEDCQGSYLPEALKVMENKGLASLKDMPYSDQDCSQRPNNFQLQSATQFKIEGYQRLTGGSQGQDASSVNMLAIKQNIAQGAPVLIGMMVGGSFMQEMMGEDMWTPSDGDYDMRGFGGHAMCVIGYDDYKFARNMGGFQIMNSWGMEWGKNGVGWVSYDDFQHFTKEAYGIYPMSDASAPQTNMLQAQIGVVLNDNGQRVALHQKDAFNYTTVQNMTKGAGFKLEITNNIACYAYIFGMETDGTSYTLFPYTPKHSPFFGITGSRLFPRDHSFFADDVGTTDYFAIVISGEPLDYDAFSKRLSSAAGASYSDKLQSVIGQQNATFSYTGNAISVQSQLQAKSLLGCVVEVKK
jgi:C1A family cysteine protease